MSCLLKRCLLVILAFSFPFQATFALNKQATSSPAPFFLPETEAFQADIEKNAQGILVSFKIAKGYYLYRERFQVTPSSAPLELSLPPGQATQDILGRHEVYFNKVAVQISPHPAAELPLKGHPIQLTYQGCAESGYCYAPMHVTLPDPLFLKKQNATTSPPKTTPDVVISSNWAVTFFKFVGLGLLLSLTPCSWPMLPILSGLIVGTESSRFKALSLSLTYVLSMAITQGIIGLIMAYLGYNLQAYLQQPLAIVVQMLLLIGLAVALVAGRGVSILPPRLEDRLRIRLGDLKTHGFLEATIAGILGTLILTPCTSAPFIGVITYLTQQGNIWLGASALFALGIGTGLPLILMGTSLGFWLPKAGRWLTIVSETMAVALIGFALYLGQRIWAPDALLGIWGAFLVLLGAHFGVAFQSENTLRRWLSGLSLCLIIYGSLLFIGATMGHRDFFHPLRNPPVTGLFGGESVLSTSRQAMRTFTQPTALHQAIEKAQHQHQGVVLDFSAAWCVECVLFEQGVWPQEEIQHALKQYDVVFLRADLSRYTEDAQKMMADFKVFAPPTLIFLNARGQEIQRIFGPIRKNVLLKTIQGMRE